jgi:transposase
LPQNILLDILQNEVRNGKLSPSQKQQFQQMLLQETPIDYGIDRNLWTAKIMIQVIEQTKQKQFVELLKKTAL